MNVRKEDKMQKLIFVMGAPATGKSYYIEQNYAGQNVDIFDVYDYQQRVYDEAEFGEIISFGTKFRCLYEANNMLLKDIIEALLQGRNVVVEHTLYKANRRIAYIDEIRKVSDVTIEFYVMSPSDSLWESNLKKRKLEGGIQSYTRYKNQIEFPNVAEGIDKIFEVIDNKVNTRMDSPRPEILETARNELVKETKRIQEEDAAEKKYKELLESMKIRPFWHYCEVCGKKEFITADTAFNDGWDYPPHIGTFRLLGPRTCSKCSLEDTLFWKVNTNGSLPIVIESELTPEELVTWRRIKAEPESLLA